VVWDIAVSVTTRYRPDGPEIKSQEGWIFRTHPDRPPGPPSLLYRGFRVIPVVKAAALWRWTPTPSSMEVKQEESYTSTSPLCVHDSLQGKFYLYLIIFRDMNGIYGIYGVILTKRINVLSEKMQSS